METEVCSTFVTRVDNGPTAPPEPVVDPGEFLNIWVYLLDLILISAILVSFFFCCGRVFEQGLYLFILALSLTRRERRKEKEEKEDASVQHIHGPHKVDSTEVHYHHAHLSPIS